MVNIRELDCGVKFVNEKLESVRSLAIGIFVKAGSVDEIEEYAGISHFIEHMLFKGTEKRTAKQIAVDSDRIAAQMNAFTGREMTCYYLKTLTENAEEGVELLLDMFMHSKFDQVEIDRERNVIYEEMKMIEDTPDDIINDYIQELVFSGNQLARPIIGTRESLARIQREHILKYRERRYAQDSVVIAVSGNFDEDRLAELFNRAFDGLKENKKIYSYGTKDYEPGYISKVRDIEQTHISLGTRSVKWGAELYYPITVLTNIIGGSMSSRLFQNIREEKGLAYAIYAGNASACDLGMFNIYAGVAHDKVAETVSAIRQELTDVRKNLVTEEELEMAKTQLKGNYIFGLEGVNSRMFGLGRHLTLHGRVVSQDETLDAIDAVSMDDIRRAADLITDFDNYCGVVISKENLPIEELIRG